MVESLKLLPLQGVWVPAGYSIKIAIPSGVPADLKSAVKKRFDLLKRGIWNPPIFRLHSCLLRISNPQSLNRLGHFLTPDCKSGGTPGGLAFLILYYNPGWLFNSFSVSSLDGRVISGFTILPFGSRRMKRGIPLMR